MKYYHDLKEFSGNIKSVAKRYHIPAALLYADCIGCRIIHGAGAAEYIGLSMYQMSGCERRQYVTLHRSVKLEKIFNTGSADEKAIIGDKHIFNRTFSKYVQRDWIYAPDHTDAEVEAFLRKHAVVMVKPLSKSKGVGVRKISTADWTEEQMTAFLCEAKEEKLLVEEVIRQHPVLSAVNPSSVNTIRVATVRDGNGEVHIIGASLRAGGKDKVVDNLHSDGVQYPIDVSTGCILRSGVTYDGRKNILYHPSTQTKMIGLQIPNWDKVVATVKEAGRIPVNMRYIGWDIAVTEDGCEIIEANYKQGSNGMQQDGKGKYDTIKSYK